MKYHDEILDRRLPEILDAVLVWRDDPKCKLRVKGRMVVTRLATKCGFDRVEKLIPGNYAKAFAHIRKAASKKDRKRREGTSKMVSHSSLAQIQYYGEFLGMIDAS